MKVLSRRFIVTALLTGCRAPGLEVTASLNDTTVTVVELDWSTEQPGTSWVEYGTTEEYELRTPTFAASSDHHIALYGLPPLSTVFYRAVTEVDGREHWATGELWTENIPASFPDIEVTVHEPSLLSSEPYMMGLLVGISSAIFVVNRQGQVVWYRELEPFVGPKPPVYGEIEFALDGNDLVFNQFTADLDDPDGLNAIFRVALTGDIVDVRSTPLAHHAFVQLGDGRYAYLAADVRPYQLPGATEPEDIVGDAIVIVERDGTTTPAFSTWDWSLPETVAAPGISFYSGMSDWTHANGLAWYPEDGTFLLSAGYSDAVLEIDADSGQVSRHFGSAGDVDIAAGSTSFFFQHDPHWTEDGTLLMTSAYFEGEDQGEYEDWVFIAVEYGVEGDQLDELWSYGKDQGLGSVAEGQARRLANGNTMVNWGFSGICREVTPEGEVAWELAASAGAGMVHVKPMTSFYEGR